MFIVGFDADTRDTFARIDAFAAETNLFNMNVEWLTPVPGTCFRKIEAEGDRRGEGGDRLVRARNLTRRAAGAHVWLAWRHAEPARAADRAAASRSSPRSSPPRSNPCARGSGGFTSPRTPRAP
jgi:hypothetical protein